MNLIKFTARLNDLIDSGTENQIPITPTLYTANPQVINRGTVHLFEISQKILIYNWNQRSNLKKLNRVAEPPIIGSNWVAAQILKHLVHCLAELTMFELHPDVFKILKIRPLVYFVYQIKKDLSVYHKLWSPSLYLYPNVVNWDISNYEFCKIK